MPGCCAQPETSLRGLFQWSEAHCGTRAVQVTSDAVNHSLFQVPAVLSKPPPDGMPPVKCRAVLTPRPDGNGAAGNQRQPEWQHCKSVYNAACPLDNPHIAGVGMEKQSRGSFRASGLGRERSSSSTRLACLPDLEMSQPRSGHQYLLPTHPISPNTLPNESTLSNLQV